MSHHTPGPWKTGTGAFADQVFVDDQTGEQGNDWGENLICETAGSEANARLIAAAPDLLEALKACLADDFLAGEVYEQAVNAIARAEGGSL